MSVTLKAVRGNAWTDKKFGAVVGKDGINARQNATADRSEDDLVNGALVTSMKIIKHVLDVDPETVVTMYSEGGTLAIEAATLDTEEDIVLITISTTGAKAAKAPARKVAPAKKAPAKAPTKGRATAGAVPARKTAPPAKKAATAKKAAATPTKKAAPVAAKKAAPATAKKAAPTKAPAKAATGRKTTPPRKAAAKK